MKTSGSAGSSTASRPAKPLELAAMAEKLLRDPSLRNNEQGKEMLRLLHVNAVGAEQLRTAAGAVPPHCGRSLCRSRASTLRCGRTSPATWPDGRESSTRRQPLADERRILPARAAASAKISGMQAVLELSVILQSSKARWNASHMPTQIPDIPSPGSIRDAARTWSRLPVPNLVADAAEILEVPAQMIGPCLDELAAAEGVTREDLPAAAGDSPPVPAVYLPPFYHAERSVAAALLRVLSAREERLASFASVDWNKALGWLRGRTGTTLAPEQEEAVRLALTSRVAVLTGGPGCGKSFTVRSVVELAKAKRAKVILAAPTGRAARRLAELTGHEAATIHRLQLRPGGDASFDGSNPLDADLVVVDETSMVDVILANKLVKAIPPGHTCSWSETLTSSRRWAPERCCATCSPPERSPWSG
jgi:AAA domain